MTIENTSSRDPIVHLAGAMSPDGMTGYVEGMETQGQQQVLASASLPVDSDWRAFAEIGVRQKGHPNGDLFVEAEVPAGWTREGSDHAMQSYVCDERGVRRISVFYKAAFYDRRASAHVLNVGQTAAGEAIYGDDDTPLPDKWDVFTADERADYEAGLRAYFADAERNPNIYAKRLPRVRAALQLIGEQ